MSCLPESQGKARRRYAPWHRETEWKRPLPRCSPPHGHKTLRTTTTVLPTAENIRLWDVLPQPWHRCFSITDIRNTETDSAPSTIRTTTVTARHTPWTSRRQTINTTLCSTTTAKATLMSRLMPWQNYATIAVWHLICNMDCPQAEHI